MQNNVNKSHLRVQALCEGAILVAVAQILGYIKLFPMWPNGGSITLAAFPIALYAVRWGVGRGLLAGFVFGVLQLLMDEAYAWGWQSMLLDYLVAFTPLGLAGLFKGKKWGIFPGIVLGNLGRFVVHYISGVTIYRIYEPTEIPGIGTFDGAELYSLVYNGSYMLPCMLLALAAAVLLYAPMKRYFAGSDLNK
jgi:thiamine transporter